MAGKDGTGAQLRVVTQDVDDVLPQSNLPLMDSVLNQLCPDMSFAASSVEFGLNSYACALKMALRAHSLSHQRQGLFKGTLAYTQANAQGSVLDRMETVHLARPRPMRPPSTHAQIQPHRCLRNFDMPETFTCSRSFGRRHCSSLCTCRSVRYRAWRNEQPI
jgi:hypothetical protein